ncbi:MAG TPA: IS200/IS605 family transposase, partial [Thermoanaerobaculia bacterium]|nr:IS200/IS605 family transposase [Thermoanaerobaculia bacterium]
MHTYASIYIHVVFATWNRHPFLDDATRPRLHAYFAGTARNRGVAEVTVGGVEDHLHFIGRFDPAVAFSPVIGQLKKSSTDWLRENFRHLAKFRWQRGFGAFSVSVDRVPSVNRYIARQ